MGIIVLLAGVSFPGIDITPLLQATDGGPVTVSGESGRRPADQKGSRVRVRDACGRVQPEGCTHGTSEQRQRWLGRGYGSGDIGVCHSFAADQL